MNKYRPEYMKKDGMSMMEWLMKIFNVYSEAGRVPEEELSACIVSLYNIKSDKHNCSNSKNICQLSLISKEMFMEGIRK